MSKKQEWYQEIPKDLPSAPGAFMGFLIRVNACLQAVRALAAMKGTGGIDVTISDGNIVISTKAGQSPMPTGYGPEEFTICDSGSPVTRKFLTDNPDPA